jgi:hypothetical protein
MESSTPQPIPAIALEPQPPPAPRAPAWQRHSVKGFVWALAICIVLLYILNNILQNYIMPLDPNISKDYPGFIVAIINGLAGMKVHFLTEGFISCLWAVNTALTVAILGYFSLLLYRPRWYLHLVQALICLVAILPFYIIYVKFPLFFSTASATDHARIALYVIMAIFAAGFISEFTRFTVLRLKGHLD